MHPEIIEVGGQQYCKATWPHRIAGRMLDIALVVGIWTAAGESLLPLVLPLSIGYLFIGNGLFGGAGFGKRLTGMKVIDARHGGACSIVQDFVRHRYLFGTPLESATTKMGRKTSMTPTSSPFTISFEDCGPNRRSSITFGGWRRSASGWIRRPGA